MAYTFPELIGSRTPPASVLEETLGRKFVLPAELSLGVFLGDEDTGVGGTEALSDGQT